LMLPESALVRVGEQAWVWRETDGNPDAKLAVKPGSDGSAGDFGKTLRKVALVLGARDARSGNWEVRSGLAAGERVLRHPGPNLTDGQALAPSTSAAAAASGKGG
jgi:membrane fusion protein (multidrug efflux system)